MQVLRDKLREASFRPEEKIRTCEGALEYLVAASPEHLFAARSGVFPMPSKPGFLLQDAWDAAAAWARTVGKMGLTEGLNRLGTRAYNRRLILHAASARPRMKAESPTGALKRP
ncbi:hypothetical protein TRVL_10370 [Trypanosoma vivax]|nr:hypothetical protein TRVL_10370 [Trypanosoma vivax]